MKFIYHEELPRDEFDSGDRFQVRSMN